MKIMFAQLRQPTRLVAILQPYMYGTHGTRKAPSIVLHIYNTKICGFLTKKKIFTVFKDTLGAREVFGKGSEEVSSF